MPNLIGNHRKKITEAKLKETYSILEQAFRMAEAKHGDVNYWPEWDDAELILTRYIAPEIKSAKVFPTGDSETNLLCYEGKLPSDHKRGDSYTQYAWIDKVGIGTPFVANSTASMKLLDGTCIGLNNSKVAAGVYAKQIFIDTNGSYRAPNIAGMDLFFFTIKDNMIFPHGYDWETSKLSNQSIHNSCHKKASRGGFVCAAKIMRENWQINYW